MSSALPERAALSPAHAWIAWSVAAGFFFYAFVLRVSPSVMVDELMAEFQVGGAVLGTLSSLYFFAYAPLQLPAGMLMDRFGPRRLITGAAALAALGGALFAFAPAIEATYVARLLIGFGCGFSFVGALTVTTQLFPPARFALLAGLVQGFGILGGIVAQAPLGLVVDALTWRGAMGVIAGAGALLTLVAWLSIRDRVTPTPAGGLSPMAGLRVVAASRETWLCAAFGLSMTAPMLAFGGLWAVPFVGTVYHFDRATAASLVSLLFLGWGIGAPVIGFLSDRVGRRRAPMIVFSLIATASMAAIVGMHGFSVATMGALFFVNGFASCSMILCFAAVRAHNPPETTGAAYGLVNTFVVGSGAVFQPLIGFLLDLGWDGTMAGGARVYAEETYRVALWVLPAISAVAVAASAMMREAPRA